MKNLLLLGGFLIFWFGCTQKPKPQENQSQSTGLTFVSVTNHYDNKALVVPEGAQVDVLYRSVYDSAYYSNGDLLPAKRKIDFLAYQPIDGSSEHGYIFMNHEMRHDDPKLGDGGGMSWIEVKRENGQWIRVGYGNNTDFLPLGGTWHNCGGTVTPNGTILTAEEYPPATNMELYNKEFNYADTADFDGMKRNENLGWIVEVDMDTKKPLRKLWMMGRYSHEDAHCMADNRTIYLTDDFQPCVFFKFVAETAGNYTNGQLFAYQQGENGEGGSWITLPMALDSLIYIRDIAISKGATLFTSHEWVEEMNGLLYISESGGNVDYSDAVAKGGKVAHHLAQPPLAIGENKITDHFGRILAFDPETNNMSVFLEGGQLPDGGYFTRPDGMIPVNLFGKDYLIVCEDAGLEVIVDNKIESWEQGKLYMETYVVPVDGPKADPSQIKRLTVGPEGCEQTGLAMTPDRSTLFLTVQNPAKTNPAPYNESTIVAITGIFE